MTSTMEFWKIKWTPLNILVELKKNRKLRHFGIKLGGSWNT